MRYARIEPQALQVELHPYLAQNALTQLAKTLGIAVTAYSSFGPQSYKELGAHNDTASLLEHNVVADIAKAHNKSELQLDCSRWHVVLVNTSITSSSCGTSASSMGDSARYRRYSQEQQS
jgi:diketogulonate reductase-like aldo/keto reductase